MVPRKSRRLCKGARKGEVIENFLFVLLTHLSSQKLPLTNSSWTMLKPVSLAPVLLPVKLACQCNFGIKIEQFLSQDCTDLCFEHRT